MRLKKLILGLLLLSISTLNAQDKTLPDSKINYHEFELNIGYSYRLFSEVNELFVNQNQFTDHNNSLKHGLQISFTYDYLIKPYLGLGFKTSAFNSAQTTYSAKDSMDIKDDIYMFYAGPSVKYIFPTFSNNWSINIRATAGYLSFRNSSQIPALSQSGTVVPASLTYKGATIGYGLDLGLDYKINSFTSVGCNAGFFGGNLSKLTLGEDKITLNNKENLNRLDITIGVRIRL